MLRIVSAPEPSSFRTKVELPGEEYLQQYPHAFKGERMPNYWNKCKDDLYDAYHGICAYTLMRIHKGHGFEMDHFRPKGIRRYRKLAYKWSNFRLATPAINKHKWRHLVADPFKIPKDAFVVRLLTDGWVVPNSAYSVIAKKFLSHTIDKLQLNDHALPEERVEAYTNYRRREWRIKTFTTDYPFVAYETLRMGMIYPEDRDECRRILKEDLGFSWITI